MIFWTFPEDHKNVLFQRAFIIPASNRDPATGLEPAVEGVVSNVRTM